METTPFFRNVITYYKEEDHQYEALKYLEYAIEPNTLETFKRIWRKHFNRFSQRDNLINPYVSCNASSHAMLVDFLLRKHKRGSLASDNEYVAKVYSGDYGKYGSNNSVSWDIQLRVVRSYGFDVEYTSAGKESLIDYLLDGYIAPCNFKHKGSLSHPFGGHVVVAVDYDPRLGFLITDPFGSPMPTYKNKWDLDYWITEKEFDARTQGIFTRLC